MNRICWLASYPKSGNTWFRAFLTALIGEEAAAVDINKLETDAIASARGPFDDAVGVEGSDLTPEEVFELRPQAMCDIARRAERMLYIKIHDAYTLLPDGRPFVPTEATFGALYFIRNPLDVAPSYANHCATDIDSAIAMMGNPEHTLAHHTDRLPNQFPQRALSWSGHVLSWAGAPIPVHVMRYEDMHARPLETFTAAARFARLPDDPGRVAAALEACRFDKLQAQEREGGFREKNPKSEAFFRKGKVGGWRGELTDVQRDRIIADHADVMRRFGYLSDDGEPLC